MRHESVFNLRQSFGLELDMPMDAGIAPYVHVLRREGIETYESCQGGPGHVFPEPTIRFHGGRGEGFKAFAIATTHGLPVYAVRRIWTVDDGELTGPFWEIVFREKAQSEGDF
ncbi:hypothetical protein [Mesorhizobium sp. M0809]|uniref:hypothetical protein n=1 Tax=Mesorhizobium sp. M0809 TaxID=2957003 RepID=UPI00333879C1